MSAGEVHLERISPGEISVIDDFALEPTELEFAGGSAREIARRVDDSSNAENHCLFLIGHRSQTIGFLGLREADARPEWASGDAMTLHNLRIRRSSRRSGLARAAIVAAVRWIADSRPDVLRLELSVNEQNDRAISFYCRCGFSRTGAFHSGRLGLEIVMTAPIATLVANEISP